MERLVIVTGAYGSGKSEYCINLALESRSSQGQRTALVDLDLVNAYFRSREVSEHLKKHEVELVAPGGDLKFSDLPITGPGIAALIQNEYYPKVILDMGGDETGAAAMGCYQDEINSTTHTMLMIVNPFRPYTHDSDSINSMKEAIESASGISIDGLISNPNLGAGTSLPQVLAGHHIVKTTASSMQLPVLELVVREELYKLHQPKLDEEGITIRPLKIYLLPSWLVTQQKEDQTAHDYKVF